MAKRKHPTAKPEKKSVRNPLPWLILILVCHVILGLVYWNYIPYGISPDEAPHGTYVEHLSVQGSIPVYDTGPKALPDEYEFYQPPAYYVAAVPFYLAGKALHLAEPESMVRLLSLILGALSIMLIYGAVVRTFPDRRDLALACAGFVALLPTHVMTSSMVSNDILMEAVFALALLLMADMLSKGLTTRNSVLLGITLGIGLLTKMTCLALVPIAVGAFLLVWIRGKSSLTSALAQMSLAFIIALVIGGWWFARNQRLYHDLLGLAAFQHSFLSHSPNVQDWLSAGMSPLLYLQMLISWSFRSFWGAFGHLKDESDFMPAWTYWTLAVISIAAAFGFSRAYKQLKAEPSSKSGIFQVYGVTLAIVFIAFIKLNMTVFQAQGRYLYPALIPISIGWVLGIEGLLPSGRKNLAPFLAVGITALVQIVALLCCVLPAAGWM